MWSASNPYVDISTTPDYPKSLMVRNHKGGLIWQHYIVRSKAEADALCANSWENGFYGSTLEDVSPLKETWPDWRETCKGSVREVLVPDTDEPNDAKYWAYREMEERVYSSHGNAGTTIE